MDQLLEVEVISDDKHRGDQKDHWTKDFRKWVGMVELRRKGRHIAPGPASVPLHQLFPCLASAPRTPLPFTAEELHLISSSFMLTGELEEMRRQWDKDEETVGYTVETSTLTQYMWGPEKSSYICSPWRVLIRGSWPLESEWRQLRYGCKVYQWECSAWGEERKTKIADRETKTGDRGKKRKYTLNLHLLCARLVNSSPSHTLHSSTTFKV